MFGIFAAAALIVLVIEWAASPREGVLFEVATAGIQVAGVAVLGGVVTLLTFGYQERSKRELDEFDREVERQADERDRQDEYLRSQLQSVLTHYNAVKSIRRELGGEVGPAKTIPVRISALQGLVPRLNEEQLEFESMAVLAGSATDNRLPKPDFVDLLRRIERTLNKVVDELRGAVAGKPADGTLTVAQLSRTSDFLDRDGFKKVSLPKDVLVELLQRALLVPLERQTLHEFRAARRARA